MTYKNAKIILFASIFVAMVLSISVTSLAEAAPNEHANEMSKYKTVDIGKFADGTLDEQKGVDRINYLREICITTKDCHEDEIEQINNEVKKLYKVDPEQRELMDVNIELFQEYMENVLFSNLETGEERMNSFPIVSIGVNSKGKAIQITLDSDYAKGKDFNKYKKIIDDFFDKDVKVKIRVSEGIYIDSHTYNREYLTVSPLQGGASIGLETSSGLYNCTIGYLATDSNGNVGIVSAGHCPDSVGDTVRQPVTGINDVAEVTRKISSTYCDCSFSILDDQNNFGPYVLYNSQYSIGVTGTNTIGTDDVGITIAMSGAVSGYRTGQITDNSFDVYDNGVRILSKVVVAQYVSSVGDSGAPILDGSKLTGIHVAHDITNGDDYSVNISRTNSYLRVTPEVT